MPRVTRISIAPVKGLALVQPAEVELETTGVLANRRFHILEADRRRYNQLLNGALVQVRPDYDPVRGQLTLTFPDGTVAQADFELGDELTLCFYRPAGT